MGAFVLGVLVGWLAEWLFYTFWVKAGENDGDCSAIKAELELKNRQISSLQSQLSSISESKGKDSKAAAKPATSSSSKKATLSSTKESAKTSTNATAAKTIEKTANKNSASAKAKSAKGKTSTSKNAPKVKKAATKSSTQSSASKTTSTITKRKARAGGDDFTKLSGIGPSMSAVLKSLGIDTFKKLADTDDDILRDMLEKSGARMNNNKEAMDSWNEQASVAATGDFKALKAMQVDLKK